MKKILIIMALLLTSSVFAVIAPTVTISPTGPINIFPGDTVSLTGLTANCSFSQSITWKDPVKNSLGVGLSINFQPTISGKYYAAFYCKGVLVNTGTVIIIINSPIVNAGVDQSVNSSDTVNLAGTIQGFKGCQIDYTWSQISGTNVSINGPIGTLFISDNLVHNITGSFQAPGSSQSMNFKLNIVASSCSQSTNSPYYDNIGVNVTSTSSSSSSSSSNSSSSVFGGRSYDSRMQEDAANTFSDVNINNIKLKLGYMKLLGVSYGFYWNNIGGEGYVNYVLEYSTGANFNNSKQFINFGTNFNLTKYDLHKKYDLHYFRIKAVYQSKSSDWSNIIIINSNYLLDKYKFKCTECGKKINFKDAYNKIPSILAKYFKIKCIKNNCKIKKNLLDK